MSSVVVENPVDVLRRQLRLAGLPAPEPEWTFDLIPRRLTPSGRRKRGRFDLCWPAEGLAVEVEGVVEGGRRGGKSRHTTLNGYRDDCRKYNTAAFLGFRLLRFTQDQVVSEESIRVIRKFFAEIVKESSIDETDLAPALAGGKPHPLDPERADDGAGG